MKTVHMLSHDPRRNGGGSSQGHASGSSYYLSGNEAQGSGREGYLRRHSMHHSEVSSDLDSDSDLSDDVSLMAAARSRYSHRPRKGWSSSENILDSDDSSDNGLVYGDFHTAARNYVLSASPSTSSSKLDFSKSSSKPGGPPTVSPLPPDRPEKQVPGSFPRDVDPNRPIKMQPSNSSAMRPVNVGTTTAGPPTSPTYPSNWAPIPECEMPGFVQPSSQPGAQMQTQAIPGAFPPSQPQIDTPTPQHANSERSQLYAQPQQWQYAQVDPNTFNYVSMPSSQPDSWSAAARVDTQDYTMSGGLLSSPTAITPSNHRSRSMSSAGKPAGNRPSSLSVSSVNNLSVSTPSMGRAPASPLLEPYKGTYQSISPMPSPIVIPAELNDDLSDIEPLDKGSERRKHGGASSKELKVEIPKESRSRCRSRHTRHHSDQHSRSPGPEHNSMVLISPSSGRKMVSFYDPVPDAVAMSEALARFRSVDIKILTRILPHLSSDEILALRKEYKNLVKVHGKGINIAKHIRLKLGNTSLGKICYATALGRWESEAFWANCYYQSSTSRRELLIESLMGRTNAQIREIKECFRDSRYLDSLEKCMKAELKADKFRMAILLALEERRQEEREPLNAGLVQRDLQDLRRALVSREGGETAMIFIIVLRSDAHLREVLRVYDHVYRENFTRAMIAKSGNLVVCLFPFTPS